MWGAKLVFGVSAAVALMLACVPHADENQCLETIHLIDFDEVRGDGVSAALALERLALPTSVPAALYADAPIDLDQSSQMTQVFLDAIYDGGEVRFHDRRQNPDATQEIYPSPCHDYISADVSLTLASDNAWFESTTVDATVRMGKVWRIATPYPDELHDVFLRAEIEPDDLPGLLATASRELAPDLLFLNWRAAEHIDGELAPARGELSLRGLANHSVRDEAIVWFGEPDPYDTP